MGQLKNWETRLGDLPIEGNEKCALTALCRISKHTRSSEAHFAEATYSFVNPVRVTNKVVTNEQGKKNKKKGKEDCYY